MEYYYITCGRMYQLPKRTLEVDEAIDRIMAGNDRLRAGEITRRQLREEQRNFVMEEPDVRQELIRLINQTRKANGVAELPVSEALMTAAQTISDKRYSWHHNQEECEAAIASGYPYGFGVNLTVFTGVAPEDTAQHALENWLNSPGHFETMIKPDCDSIGVGVTKSGGVTYCYMFIGRPNTHNPYE